jgi:pimeloyl-ACP methyl ester carboxylesterase
MDNDTNYITPTIKKEEHYLVILHGIYKTSKHMQKLADFMSDNGFKVLNLDYPSTKYRIEELTKKVALQIKNKLPKDAKVSFIGYSMGGLIVRAILNNPEYRPANLDKVVLLATPNKGSEVADFWSGFWLFEKLFGPAGEQLQTGSHNKKLDQLLGVPDYDLGIIAGNFTIDPFSSILLKGDDDGKVSIKSTMISTMSDHIVVNASHLFFPRNKQVMLQALYFLKYGKFDKSKKEATK